MSQIDGNFKIYIFLFCLTKCFLDLKAMLSTLGEKLTKMEQVIETQNLSFAKTTLSETSIPSFESVSLPSQSISNVDLNSEDDFSPNNDESNVFCKTIFCNSFINTVLLQMQLTNFKMLYHNGSFKFTITTSFKTLFSIVQTLISSVMPDLLFKSGTTTNYLPPIGKNSMNT